MLATNSSLMVVYCHVVIFAETMDRDLEKEELLGDIIRDGGDITLSFLNDTDGEEGDHDGSGDRVEEEGDHDGSGDPTEKGALTVSKSGEVYIY
jgi:hypothetical protein